MLIRIKKNIIDNDLGLDFINDLRPRKFNKVNPAEYPDEIKKKNEVKSADKKKDLKDGIKDRVKK